MTRPAADKARMVGESLGDGHYRITGEVSLPAPPDRVRGCLTDPDSIRTWALGGKVQIRLAEERGLYVFTMRTSSSMSTTVYGQVLVDEPRRVVRRYRDARPGAERRVGVDYERLVSYTLDPAPAGTLVRCEVDVMVRGLSERGAAAVGRVEALSLEHSLERMALLVAGRRPPLWSVLFSFVFPKAPIPV